MIKHGVEGAVFSALRELGRVVGESRLVGAAGQVLQAAAQTKAAVDDNVATVLGLAGLPSRGDIEVLRRQLDVVQVTLANLSRKLDHLVEQVSESDPEHAGGSHKGRRRVRPGKTTVV